MTESEKSIDKQPEEPLPSRRRDVFQELADRFGLPYEVGDDSNQDWELVVADANKIPWFLAEFEHLDAPARYVLTELLMASFDQAARSEVFPHQDWERFWGYLKQNLDQLSSIVGYWAGDEHANWTITRTLRDSLSRDNVPCPPRTG